jgi:hypothetical protein
MYELDEVYEPDEILRDIDTGGEYCQEEELPELSFENECEAAEGYSFLIDEVESLQELFA